MRKIALLLILWTLLLAGCAPAATPLPNTAASQPTFTLPASQGWPLPEGQYLFLDHHIKRGGECVQGTCDPGPMIDFPTYSWDAQNRMLNAMLMSFELTPELKVIYGNGSSLSGVAGGGAGTQLNGVTELPFSMGDMIIERVEADGTAHLNYQGQAITLQPGEAWRNAIEEDVKQTSGTAHFVVTDEIKNYGIISADQISKP